MTKASKNGAYPVRRGSRFDRLSCNWIYGRVVKYLAKFRPKEGEPVTDLSMDEFAYAGLFSEEPIREFARLVIYTEHGEAKHLTTMQGVEYIIPKRDCSDEDLLTAYRNYLDTDEKITDALEALVEEQNPSPTPAHMVEPEQVTEEQKADPNS